MKLTEGEFLDAESMDVLATAYRARPATRADLAALLEPDAAARLDDTLLALRRAGFVRLTGERLELESPYTSFVALSQARVQRLEAETARTVAMMQALPLLIRNWDLGEAPEGEEHPLAAVVVHGRENHWEVWRRHLAEEQPERPSWVLPDLGMLREDFPWRAEEVAGGAATGSARVIVRPSDIDDAANQELVAVSAALGVEVRVLDELPSWFYVDADRVAGFPVNWGEAWPTSMILVRTPPIIAALGELFDSLWRRAEPAVPARSGWEPVIRLLAQGMTDEAVARFLGLDVRTVRRRVADAMEELGATSRFALGSAWERRRAAAPPRSPTP